MPIYVVNAYFGAGGKNSADRSLLLDLMYWVSQNPPPAHLFLISGDRDFASILHRLRMNNYNILLASPECAPGVLCSAASIMWHWQDLLRGENLTGKHFNQPPDGPYGSWYGHYKVPLLNPFSDVEQAACSQTEESFEPGSDCKLRPIPKAIVKKIRSILNSHPKGLPIIDLHSELQRTNWIDKDWYGYKKFSRFLLSMPHILQLKSDGDGQSMVHGTTSKSSEPLECNSGISVGPASKNEDTDLNLSSKLSADGRSINGRADRKIFPEKLSKAMSPNLNVNDTMEKGQLPFPPDEKVETVIGGAADRMASDLNVKDTMEKVETVNNTQESESHLHAVVRQDSPSEVGYFKRVWRRWIGNDNDGSKSDKGQEKHSTSGNGSGNKSQPMPEKHSISDDSNAKRKDEENHLKSASQIFYQACPLSSSSSHIKSSPPDNRTTIGAEVNDNMSCTRPGIFNGIVSWYKSWRSTPSSDKLSDHACDRLNLAIDRSEEHELFSKDSFWSDMESFVDSPKGSLIVSESRTRFVILLYYV